MITDVIAPVKNICEKDAALTGCLAQAKKSALPAGSALIAIKRA
jgi:hypothetical protein